MRFCTLNLIVIFVRIFCFCSSFFGIQIFRHSRLVNIKTFILGAIIYKIFFSIITAKTTQKNGIKSAFDMFCKSFPVEGTTMKRWQRWMVFRSQALFVRYPHFPMSSFSHLLNFPFHVLVALAAQYLTLVSQWVGDCHLRI